MEMLRNWENNFLLKTKSAGQSKPDSSCSEQPCCEARKTRDEAKQVSCLFSFHSFETFGVLLLSLSLSLSLSRESAVSTPNPKNERRRRWWTRRRWTRRSTPTKSSRQKRLDRIEELRQLLPQNPPPQQPSYPNQGRREPRNNTNWPFVLQTPQLCACSFLSINAFFSFWQ